MGNDLTSENYLSGDATSAYDAAYGRCSCSYCSISIDPPNCGETKQTKQGPLPLSLENLDKGAAVVHS